MKKRTEVTLYAVLIVFAVLLVFIGNKWATSRAVMFQGMTGRFTDREIVRVDAVLDTSETDTVSDGIVIMTATEIKFSSTVILGENKGQTILATQTYDTMTTRIPTPVRKGDRIFVYLNADNSTDWYSGEFIRIDIIALVAAVFFIFLIVFARIKGLMTVIALGLSVLSIFLVFIPSILSGYNVYVSAAMICLYSIMITPFLIGGFNMKSVASIMGSTGGVILAGVLTHLLNVWMRITGIVDEDTMQVAFILDEPIDMRAISFAAILIGALGSCLDVSMSIATSMAEMSELSGVRAFRTLVSSGMKIGRDILGTQISTLIMAYIGSSVSVVLLLTAYQSSLIEMMNLEVVIIELLQMLIGAFTILFTIPATALFSAILFSDGSSPGKSSPTPGKVVFRA